MTTRPKAARRPRTSQDAPRRPAIIAFAGQKGGAGKTTAAVSIAVELHARGRRVLLVDTDPQATARTWAAVATERKLAWPTVVGMGPGLYRDDQLPALARGYDVVVVDCPPRLDATQREVLYIADVVVLPCGPSTVDAWALAESRDLVAEARRLRPELKAVVLITRKQLRTAIGRDARGVLEAAKLPVLAAELAYRVTYQEAPAAGMGPTTYAPASPAADEVRALVDELEGL